ncbi:hypothetical protein QFC22_001846 [Naganishia vaughanmartiniae]|uniref:Uncharacterized protein n=1 Tax=Naganishia vaughanmartiniae TaxID=1424756 RepID=A0ACC2XFK5_9TREE|nr:hypothetical protein QFC22_001846 [Naganishia vaughanmartiniae]
MIQKEQRKQAHRIAVSFEQEVGGSDPAVWEADVREAEALGDLSPSIKEGNMKVMGGTPRKPLDTQWQYRSATKPFQREHSPQILRSSTNGLMNSPVRHYGVTGDYEDDEEEAREEAEQYAAFLQAQAEEDRLLAEYADLAAPTTQMHGQSPANGPPQLAAGSIIDGATGPEVEEPAADTPGAELGIEMQGFTWEDAPLSDEDGKGEGGMDVEMA